MAERTKGLMALNILQLITAAAVCAIAVILVLIDVGWSELGEFLDREYWGLFSVFLLILVLEAIVFIVLFGSIFSVSQVNWAIVLMLTFAIWGILEFIAAIGLLKRRRWALRTTLILNIPLSVLMIMAGMSNFWRPLSFWVIIPILVIILLVINRGEFE